MKLSPEAFNKIMDLLEQERDLQNGNADAQEEIDTIISEVENIGTY